MAAISSKSLSNRQVLRAALVVLLGFLASGVLGLVRTAVFSATFGTSAELDAFYAAQRIPEMLFTLVAGGALGSSFIPVFSRYLAVDDRDGAWRLASAVMTLSACAAAILALILVFAAPVLVPDLLVHGKPEPQQALTTSLTQMMLITTIIFAISGLLMGILNAHQRFLLPALALSMNNIGLIFGALVITKLLPDSVNNVYGLAWGAILGAVLHLLIQLPGLPAIRAHLRPLFDLRIPGVKEVLVLMGPRVLGLAITQINFVVNIAFASSMAEGSLVALNTAWFLMFFVLGIIAQSVGTAVFPTLSALVAENDMQGYKERLSTAMRSVLFLSLPASAGLIVLGIPVINVMFERGEWTHESTLATAWALSFFALGIPGHSLLEVLSRAFYALSDTWTPVRIGVIIMLSNIVCSLIFIQFIGDPDSLSRGPIAGLALANSLTTLLEGAVLWWLMSRRMSGINDAYILEGAGKALIAALGMAVVVVIVATVLDNQSALIVAPAGMLAGGITFFALAALLRLDEVSIFVNRAKRILRR